MNRDERATFDRANKGVAFVRPISPCDHLDLYWLSEKVYSMRLELFAANRLDLAHEKDIDVCGRWTPLATVARRPRAVDVGLVDARLLCDHPRQHLSWAVCLEEKRAQFREERVLRICPDDPRCREFRGAHEPSLFETVNLSLNDRVRKLRVVADGSQVKRLRAEHDRRQDTADGVRAQKRSERRGAGSTH
jgi:hypothetical protein